MDEESRHSVAHHGQAATATFVAQVERIETHISVVFLAGPYKEDMSKEDTIRFWSADNAGRTRTALEKGASALAKMISYDFKSDRIAEEKFETSDSDPIFPDVRVIAKEDDCLITRLPVNTLKTVCKVN